ncbi:hypothetical protein GGI25_002754 [Coemansia spiralis]|uniref:Uncharacterized protein n=2 Tax=Coemansia TaxID=4863 RepID=A0A9W8G7B6_9FUNG|nr:hypothetical protein EDC05_002126 [Coemansia umbellata]KAJ2625257.1 hypothetical protein GGI26_000727 [Coemansia sp. RSA 1358]KAJ2677964.1 hypothetical protein GGI25_002754 [Coemansia spiralis]
MSDTDDFNYESVVSDPGVYDGILGSTSNIRSGVGLAHQPSSTANTAAIDARSMTNSNNIITPSTNRAETPEPRGLDDIDANGPSDSTPSLAISTPNSDKFQFEYDRERRDYSEFGGSQQSQYDLKSGMYINGSTSDFTTKLKGDVIVSAKWSTVGEMREREMENTEHASQPPTYAGMIQTAAQENALEDTTFDLPSFNEPTDFSLSRLIRQSSADDIQRQSGFEHHYPSDTEEPAHIHKQEMEERKSSNIQTPKMTRSRSDQHGMVDLGSAGEPPALRSALRKNRVAQPPDVTENIEPVPPSPRTVSFANLGPLSNSEASLPDAPGSNPAATWRNNNSGNNNGKSTSASTDTTTQESIVFRTQNASYARPFARDSSNGSTNVDRDPDDTNSIGNMSTQPLDADAATDSYLQQQEDMGLPDEEPLQHLPTVHLPLGSGQMTSSGRFGMDRISGVSLGVGMAGGMFRKFAGWTQNQLTRPHSPSTMPSTLSDASKEGEQINSNNGRAEDKARASKTRMQKESTEKADANTDSHASSLSTASSLSPVKTEPMRSQIASVSTTPTSANGTGSSATGSPFTTPTNRPASVRKTSNTPSRSVNPLTRHLAMKAMLSAPPAQRSMHGNSAGSSNTTPTHSSKNGPAQSLVDHNSISGDSDAYDVSATSAMLSLAEIQKQFESFANHLKHDASAVQADMHESENVWNELQLEMEQLKTKLADVETTRDFYQRQAEEAEKSRLEWEMERQQLSDECNDLQANIEQWRHRIGDLENERQGVWNEGTQSREQLLHTIARLEIELSETRAEASSMKIRLSSINVEFDKNHSDWEAEREEIFNHVDDVMANVAQLGLENQDLQAEIHDTREQLKESQMLLDKGDSELRVTFERNLALEHELTAATEKLEVIETKHVEAAERIGRLEQQVEDLKSSVQTAEMRETDLKAENASLKETNKLLQETLEDLTEQNHELKGSSDESHFFKTALNETVFPLSPQSNKPAANADAPSAEPESETVAKLKAEHREALEKVSEDYSLLVETMKSLTESKQRYKTENTELADMAEVARNEIELLKKQLSEARLSTANAPSNSRDTQLTQLHKNEERLQRDLDIAERDRDEISKRMRALDDRNKHLMQRNDELAQRTARLETELSDLQMHSSNARDSAADGDSEDAKMKEKELEYLHTTVADLEKELSRNHVDNDKLRQTIANMEVELDDALMDLTKVRGELDSEKKSLNSEREKTKNLQQTTDKLNKEMSGLQDNLDTPGTSTANSPSMDQPEKMSQAVRHLQTDITAREQSISQLSMRLEKLKKEQRFLADQLRDTLLRNATLRKELTDILLRRAGKFRELHMLQNAERSLNDIYTQSDDGDLSIMSGTIDMVPSTSQLLDGNTNSRYFSSLDKHLDVMENIIDDEDERSDKPLGMHKNALKRSNSQPTASRMQKKMLTPIKEEFGAHGHSMHDVSVQCNLLSEETSVAKKKLEEELETARERLFRLEEDCRALQAAVASVKQERDQFKVSHEEAAERVSHLTSQIDELSENHERMKAVNITTARISLRVNRQLAVLKKTLARLEPRETVSTSSQRADPQLSQIEAEDKEDALALEEDDAMLNATIDHPLRKGDLALLGLNDANPNDDTNIPESPYLDSSEGYDKINNGDVLEQVGVAVSEAYTEIKRIRRDVVRVKRERARLMKRLAEVERSKLPSFELSAQWDRKLRSRSYTESLVPSSRNVNGNVDSEGDAAGQVNAEENNVSGNLLDDTDPPPSLFLADESLIMAEIAVSRRKLHHGDDSSEHGDDGKLSSEALGPDGQFNINMSVLRDPAAAVKEMSRLLAQIKKKDRRLQLVEKDCDRLEEFNRELVQKLDRSYADKLRVQQEYNAMTIRTSARTAGRTNTPSRSTDWDELDSIQRELERCKNRNKEYFVNVDKLCRILNQHTLDRALADCNEEMDGSKDDNQKASGISYFENIYRTLLMDMAVVLDAKGDLNEKKSIRDNFNSMAAAVRKRLDEKDAKLKKMRSQLDVSRLASEAANNASVLSAKASSTTEERLRSTERRAAELETQITEAQEQLTTRQTNIRSLNDNISRLRQQCVAADSELQDARLERDGWHQQFLACEQTLNYQIEENDRLREALNRLSQLRSRNTQEFVAGGQLAYGDQSANIEWERLREEWTEATREETAQIWRNEEFVLRQTYEAQLKVYSWANKLWSDTIHAFVAQAVRDAESTAPAIAVSDNSNTEQQPIVSATTFKASGEALLHATENLDTEVGKALRRAASLQEALHCVGAADNGQNTTKRANFVEALNKIIQGLNRDFAGPWRDNIRNCMATIAIGAASVAKRIHIVSGGLVIGDSPTALSSGSSSSGFPRITDEQKAMIREHYRKREAEIKRTYLGKLQIEREDGKAREDKIKADFQKEKYLLIAESKYLRGRVQIEADRVMFMKHQKKALLKMVGGQDALLRRVDMLVHQRQIKMQSSGGMGEERREHIRNLWKRVLLAVRFTNVMYEIRNRTIAVNEIKTNAMKLMSPRQLDSATNKYQQQQQQQYEQRDLPPPKSSGYEYNGSVASNYAKYQYNKQQNYAGLKAAPSTPSKLRNRSSDLRSSTGSSVNQ